ncbi:uncharacterized protein LOC135132223 isoform X2 [Zophobas morio]
MFDCDGKISISDGSCSGTLRKAEFSNNEFCYVVNKGTPINGEYCICNGRHVFRYIDGSPKCVGKCRVMYIAKNDYTERCGGNGYPVTYKYFTNHIEDDKRVHCSDSKPYVCTYTENQDTEVVYPGDQVTETTDSQHQTTEVVDSKHQDTEVVDSEHQATEAVDSEHQTTEVVVSEHQDTQVVYSEDHVTEIVVLQHQTTEVVDSEHHVTEIIVLQHQTTEVADSKHQVTEAVDLEHQTTKVVDSGHHVVYPVGSTVHVLSFLLSPLAVHMLFFESHIYLNFDYF